MSAVPVDEDRASARDDPTGLLRDSFITAFRHHPSGVAIITADPGDGPVALTVSSLISVGVDPPTVAFSLSDRSSSADAIRRAGTVVIHFVRREDVHLARLGATSGTDRFGPGVAWRRLATGEPVYHQVHHWFRAALRGRLEAPGASVVTAELLLASPGGELADTSSPLVYADRGWHGLIPIGDGTRNPLALGPDDSATF